MWAGENVKLAFAGCHDLLVVKAGWTPTPLLPFRSTRGASSSTWSAASSSASGFDQRLTEEKTAPAPAPAPAPAAPTPPSSACQASQETEPPSCSSSQETEPSSFSSCMSEVSSDHQQEDLFPSPASSPFSALSPSSPAPAPSFPALAPSFPAPAPAVAPSPPAPAPKTSLPSRSISLAVVKTEPEPVGLLPARKALLDLQARFRSEVRMIDANKEAFFKDDEAGGGAGGKKRKRVRRVDCKAAKNLKQYALNNDKAGMMIGVVPGVEIGDTFCCRAEMQLVGLHRHPMAGISVVAYPLRKKRGNVTVKVAAAIVLNRGSCYCDNRDEGDKIVYSGQGGFTNKNKKNKKKKIEDSSPAAKKMEESSAEKTKKVSSPEKKMPDDAMINGDGKMVEYHASEEGHLTVAMVTSQTLDRGNLALSNSKEHRLPVRVIRGYKGAQFGRFHCLYSYDGLYMVTECIYEPGDLGNYVYKFRMERIKNQPPIRFYDRVPVPVSPPPPPLMSLPAPCPRPSSSPASSCCSAAAAAASSATATAAAAFGAG